MDRGSNNLNVKLEQDGWSDEGKWARMYAKTLKRWQRGIAKEVIAAEEKKLLKKLGSGGGGGMEDNDGGD